MFSVGPVDPFHDPIDSDSVGPVQIIRHDCFGVSSIHSHALDLGHVVSPVGKEQQALGDVQSNLAGLSHTLVMKLSAPSRSVD